MRDQVQLPVLYSFRRCPYAIRARLAIAASNIEVELREVCLAEKPSAMLTASPKGTVPVLVLPDKKIIEESLDIMQWALQQKHHKWLLDDNNKTQHLIHCNDTEFKIHLDHYKYADRFPENSMQHYRQSATSFLQQLEKCLIEKRYLVSDNFSLADAAIFPFIRQFAFVDKDWFEQSPYNNLLCWLDHILNSDLFNQVMKKHPQWIENVN